MTDDSPSLGGQRDTQSPRLGGEAAIANLLAIMAGDDPTARERAIDALAEIGGDRALEILLGALADDNRSVMERAARALGRLGDKRALPSLTARWRQNRRSKALLYALGQLGDAETARLLMTTKVFRRPLLDIVRREGDPQLALEALRALLASTVPPGLAKLDDLAMLLRPQLPDLLDDDDERVRFWAAYQLTEAGDPAGRDALLAALHSQPINSHTGEAMRLLLERRDLAVYDVLAERIAQMLRWTDSVSPLQEHLTQTHPTPEEQARLDAIVPQLLPFLEHIRFYLADQAVYLLRLIGSAEALAAADAYVDARVDLLLRPYLEAGPIPTQDESFVYNLDHNLLARTLDAPRLVGYHDHPLMREYAYPMIRTWMEATAPGAPFLDVDGQRWTLLKLLGDLGDPRGAEVAVDVLEARPPFDDLDPTIALEVLAAVGEERHIPLVARFLDGYGHYTSETAVQVLSEIGGAGAVEALAMLLTTPDHEERPSRSLTTFAVIMMGEIGHPSAIEHLAPLLRDEVAHMASLAATALGLIALSAGEAANAHVTELLTPYADDRRLTHHRVGPYEERLTLGEHVRSVLAAINSPPAVPTAP